ncbi:MAG: type III-B CRISPR module RAMP protein Cmr4 [Chloroflexi bacterium]|nr:MAG: type III-B CRISPR module RAMP protein Cmr4 [Chloroflexota bacterium]
MKSTTCLSFVHALSPLHAGTGQGAGIIDLPIAREKATGLPYLPGSSLKGTLRASCQNPQDCRLVFGPDMEDRLTNDLHASSAQFSDQRLLLLPVRSLAGTFAWVTSPYILRRLARDIADAQLALPEGSIPVIEDEDHCAIASQTSKIDVDSSVYLEDLQISSAAVLPEAYAWVSWIARRVFPSATDWQTMLIERFCIVHDDVFNFLIDAATEITARIKLQEDAKTVQDGGLWYEEALPTETILSGIVLAIPTKKSGITASKVFEVLQGLTNTTLQFGGKATVGRGLCRVLLDGKMGKEA